MSDAWRVGARTGFEQVLDAIEGRVLAVTAPPVVVPPPVDPPVPVQLPADVLFALDF